MDIEIAPVSEDRVPIVAAMTARAFLDEPVLRWPLGDVPDPLAAIEAEFLVVQGVAAACGCLWEAGDAIGAGAWISPDAVVGFWDEMATASVGRGIAQHAEDGGRRNRLLWEWIAGHYTDEPTWFLDHVGVDPLRQGGGVGSLLIEHGLRFAREQGLSATLETTSPQLVGYYERFGFAVTDEGDARTGGRTCGSCDSVGASPADSLFSGRCLTLPVSRGSDLPRGGYPGVVVERSHHAGRDARR